MTQKTAKILNLSIIVLLLASLFAWPTPVSAGSSVWSAETIPTTLNNMLGPAGVDVRDFVVADDLLTVYAVPGDSITDITTGNVTYKSTDSGVTWTALPMPIKANLVAVAPDDKNIVVIATSNATGIYLSINGGTTWNDLGIIKDPVGAPAAAVYDIAISPPDNDGIHYIAAAGKEALNVANLWYFDYGAPTQTWHETNTFAGFAADNEAATLAFSPDFSSDTTVVVITDNATTGVVNLQLLNINTNAWNADGSYAGFPCAVVNDAGLTNLTSASLALAPTFTPDSIKVFIGVTVNGTTATANATSGIYRFLDTVNTNLLLNAKIHSIAYNGSYLVAGSYDTCTVYRSTNPSSTTTTPTVNASYTTKCPGGENKVVVAWLGSSVIVGTSGNESSFAKSSNTGMTFDDISLIDTAIINATDVAVSSDGSKVYLVTDDGNDLSLWRQASTWRRVFSQKGTTDFLVRIEPSSANVIYLVKKGTTTIYYNSGGGAAQWLTRTCKINVQDMAVESAAVAYALDATTGAVSKTINGGASWSAATPTRLVSGATIVSVSTDILLAGSQNGFVAYSVNGSATWTKIPQQVEPGAGNVQVVADDNYATNKIIYAASDTPGQNIMTWTIGTSTAWTDIFSGVLVNGIYGLAINSNILYALEYNAGTDQSTLWRLLTPAAAPADSTGWTASTTTVTTNPPDATVRLNATPQALKASMGKLWAVKTNGTNKLYSYSDVIMNVTITLQQPADGYSIHVNSITGIAYDVIFTWQRPTVATEYQLLIAQDEDFLIQEALITVTMNNTAAYIMVGPQQAGAANINFMPGVTYYWKIRTSKPGFSQYSESRYFTIESLPDASAQLMVQGQNGMITGTEPAFSWQPLQGATEYQFMLSDNPEMTSPILTTKVSTTAIKIYKTLEYGKTYFWRVRSTKPIESDWSALVTFTVAEKPTEAIPPVIVEEAPPMTITIPAQPQQTVTKFSPPSSTTQITPDYFPWVILIMCALLGIVLFLIFGRFPGRLVPASPQHERSLGPFRKTRIHGTEPVQPQVKPETRAEGLKPRGPAEKAKMHPVTIEKGKEGEVVVFAAKSFMWMTTAEKGIGESQPGLSAKEQESLGRKLSLRIQGLAKKENLYIKYPEDAAMLLSIWARYGSRDETSSYLVKSFKSRPENAIKLLKCYLPSTTQPEKDQPATADFTRDNYNSMAEVVDPDKVYAALTRVFKFKADTIEEKTPVKPDDRNLAFRFLRIHHQAKSDR